jgi:putative glycosyltransferase (TIGR04372 family)
MERVVDYAHCDARHPELDIYLAARCRFFVGTTSGLMFLPHRYGVRTLITNYSFVFGAPPLGPASRFLPKLLRYGRRSLTFKEIMSDEVMKSAYTFRALRFRGFAYVDNTPEELALAVAEMYEPTHPDLLQKRFAELLPTTHQSGSAHVSSTFIAKHSALF